MNYATIPGFEAMTRQQLFDMSLAHLRKTRAQSLSHEGTKKAVCSYAGSGCAARPFLTDDFVASLEPGSDLDQADWYGLCNRFFVPKTNADFIFSLQSAHDSWRRTIRRADGEPGEPNPVSFMDHFHARMQTVADSYGLKYTPETIQPGESAM